MPWNQVRSAGLSIAPLGDALKPHRKILGYIAAAALASVTFAIHSHTYPGFAHARTNSLPDIILWAWERPEDLRFLTDQRIGVAFLAKTIDLPSRNSSSGTTTAQPIVRPRLQLLRVAPGIPLIAVVRIENLATSHGVSGMSSITEETGERIVAEVTSLQDIASVRAIQIDFEAHKVRILKPDQVPISGEMLPLQMRTCGMRVPIVVNGKKQQWVRLDTGCATPLQWVTSRVRSQDCNPKMAIGLTELSIPQTQTSVEIGQQKFDNIPTGLHEHPIFAGEAGLLGNGLLSRFSTVTIDAKSNRVILVPRHAAP